MRERDGVDGKRKLLVGQNTTAAAAMKKLQRKSRNKTFHLAPSLLQPYTGTFKRLGA